MFILFFFFSLFFNFHILLYFYGFIFLYKKTKINDLIVNNLLFKKLWYYIRLMKFYFINTISLFGDFNLNFNWFPLSKRTSYFTFFFFCKNQIKKNL